jgi:hypothetical protein
VTGFKGSVRVIERAGALLNEYVPAWSTAKAIYEMAFSLATVLQAE